MQPLGKQCHLGWIKSRKTKEGKGCVPSVDHSSSPTETVSHGFRGERSCHFLHCLRTLTRLGLSSFYQLQAPGEHTGRRFSSRRYFSRQELCIPFFFWTLPPRSLPSPHRSGVGKVLKGGGLPASNLKASLIWPLARPMFSRKSQE